MKTPCPGCWAFATFQPTCTFCGGAGEVDQIQFGRHFTGVEAWGKPHYLGLCGQPVPNAPGPAQLVEAGLLATTLLDHCRDDLGELDVNSWFRGPVLGHIVAPYFTGQDPHGDGTAADIRSPVHSLQDIAEWFIQRKTIFPYDQCILEYGCCHIARRAPGLYASNAPRCMDLVRVVNPAKPGGFGYLPYSRSLTPV